MPIPRELRLDVGKSTIGTVTNMICMLSKIKKTCPFLCPCLEMCNKLLEKEIHRTIC